mmetsp:Transcript_38149/g.71519  ORF Transcript_38149/g.71519 Transcript_38149/m.71519 type:complete len:918 (+) Transcript_38149:136-2889(+)
MFARKMVPLSLGLAVPPAQRGSKHSRCFAKYGVVARSKVLTQRSMLPSILMDCDSRSSCSRRIHACSAASEKSGLEYGETDVEDTFIEEDESDEDIEPLDDAYYAAQNLTPEQMREKDEQAAQVRAWAQSEEGQRALSAANAKAEEEEEKELSPEEKAKFARQVKEWMDLQLKPITYGTTADRDEEYMQARKQAQSVIAQAAVERAERVKKEAAEATAKYEARQAKRQQRQMQKEQEAAERAALGPQEAMILEGVEGVDAARYSASAFDHSLPAFAALEQKQLAKAANEAQRAQRLFVSGLSPEVDWKMLQTHFSAVGEVLHADVYRYNDASQYGLDMLGRSKEVGKVRMASAKLAKQAIQVLNGSMLAGKPIVVRKDDRDEFQEEPESTQVEPSARLYVSGLDPQTDKSAVHDLFSQVGEVESVMIFRYTNTGDNLYLEELIGTSKGCAAVQMVSVEDATAAIAELSGATLDGRTIRVNTDKRPVNSAIPGVGPGARRDQAGASSPTRLFVSGVPPTATWRDLALHFEEAGDVLHSDVHLDSSGNPVGTGMVEMADVQGARNAVETMHESVLHNSTLWVKKDLSSKQYHLKRAPRSHLVPLDPTRLFVSNLHRRVDWRQLKDHFRQAGEVVYCDVYKFTQKSKHIQNGSAVGRSKGCGIVQMADERAAAYAVEILDGSTLEGRAMAVKPDARPAEFKPAWDSPRIGDGARGDGGGGGDPTRLFVAGLSTTTTWEDLKRHFRAAGDVEYCDVYRYSNRKFDADKLGESKGCGVVQMADVESAREALAMLNGSSLDGMQLTVKRDQHKAQYNPFGDQFQNQPAPDDRFDDARFDGRYDERFDGAYNNRWEDDGPRQRRSYSRGSAAERKVRDHRQDGRGGAVFETRSGDWTCACGTVSWASKKRCFGCGAPRKQRASN